MGLREKILLADDSSIVIRSVTHMLEEDGHTVIPARSTGEVAKIVNDKEIEITLALVDVNFPDPEDGKLAADIIRKARQNITVASFSSDFADFGDLHINKYQSPKEIKAAIRAVVSKNEG